MTANLSPEYKDAEEAFRKAVDPDEKIRWLERMLSTIPKHKGTEKMQADLKRRISRLKDDAQQQSGKKGFSVTVEREGAAQIALVGAPNSGKSALVEVTTNAKTEVADYPFSTRTPVPGMLVFENLQLQLVDLPPVSREHMEPWVIDIIRNADAALWVVDASDPGLTRQVDEVLGLLSERKIQLVGPAEAGSERHDPQRKLKTQLVAAKTDLAEAQAGLAFLRGRFEPRLPVLPLSAIGDSDFSVLGRSLFALNRIVRVYSKMPGKDPDRSKPTILHQGDLLMDFAKQIHKDFAERLQYARVWGKGKFDGQRIQRDQELVDGDVIELHR